MDTFTNCMMRAARLDASLYEEVEDGRTRCGRPWGVEHLQRHTSIGSITRAACAASTPSPLARFSGWHIGRTPQTCSIAAIWMLVTMIVAVRQALDYSSTWRAVVVCVIGWLVQVVVMVGLLFALAPDTVPPA
jgi:hypothetical protein